MYEPYFGFIEPPFTLTPNTDLFYALPPHIDAIKTVLSALRMGEGLIKVTGEVGTGKTLVCRMLVNNMPNEFEVAYLPNPAASPEQFRVSLAYELGITKWQDHEQLLTLLHRYLMMRKREGKSVVVICDEAQSLSDEVLDTIRLFSNIETEKVKLLQIVLLGQPEFDERLQNHRLRQIRQRITFSAELRPLDEVETIAYINFRLERAGAEYQVFPASICKLIWRSSAGIPRMINQLCHKSLIAAFSHDAQVVGKEEVQLAIEDTMGALPISKSLFKRG